MHEQYWGQLGKLDRAETAQRAGCRYLAERDCFAISLLNREYLVDPARRTILPFAGPAEGPPAGYLEQLCILSYLVNARDLPAANTLVSAEKLDPGGFFFRGSHALATEKLAEMFGSAPHLLHKIGQGLNATAQTFGDASIQLSVLPRISLIVIVWGSDDEFAARASNLFDRSASAQLPLDVLFAAAKLTIDTIISTVKAIT
jgi:hypothetical protein